MKSLRRGLWDGEVGKDARGRFSCRICHRVLVVRSDDGEGVVRSGDGDGVARTDDGGSVAGSDESVARSCPECGRAWESRASARWRTTGK